MSEKRLKKFLIAVGFSSLLFGSLFGFLGGAFVTGGKNTFAALNFPSLESLKKFFLPAPSPSPSILEPSTPAIPPSAEAYERQIVNVVKRSSPAVVSIIITKNLPVIEEYYINPFQEFGIPLPPGFGIPQYRQRGVEKQEVGGGTGFIISADGLILTNRHVVSDPAAEYTVLMNDGSRHSASVIAKDPTFDIALVKIAKTGLATLPLGDSDALEIGQTAIAIGNALGEFRNTVSAGTVSGLSRTIQASGEILYDLIQTDAAINLGNSGGPLLNLRGEVIGVNTAVAQGAENIGFAIPINQAKKIISQVTNLGRISVPFLGVRYQIVTPTLKSARNLPVDYGALILSGESPGITPGSPAAEAGLREGDIILEFNNEKITLNTPLALLIRKSDAGDTVSLKILRERKEFTVELKLKEKVI